MATTLPPEEDNEEARAEFEAIEAPDPVLEPDEAIDLPELDLGDDLDDLEVIIDDPETERTDVPEDEAGEPPAA